MFKKILYDVGEFMHGVATILGTMIIIFTIIGYTAHYWFDFGTPVENNDPREHIYMQFYAKTPLSADEYIFEDNKWKVHLIRKEGE